MAKKKQITQEELEDILYYIDNYITTKARLCSSKDIAIAKKLPYQRVEDIVGLLIKLGKLQLVYNIPSKIKLFAPIHTVEAFSNAKPTIPWLSAIVFPQKRELVSQKESLEKKLFDFMQFELLLTATGTELVSAVANTLKWLEFNVEVKESQGHEDLEIHDGNYVAIIEVKGLERQAKIDELRQAVDYHLRKLTEEGHDNINTILLVNHFRQIEPSKRDSPFSKEVISAVSKHYQFIDLIGTVQLYERIGRCLSGKISKADIRKDIETHQLNAKRP